MALKFLSKIVDGFKTIIYGKKLIFLSSILPSDRRSPEWNSLSKTFVKQNPLCAVCGCKDKVVPHHKKPFHLYPQLELDPANLVTLCPKCHLLIGHLGSWKSYNPEIEMDVQVWSVKVRNRP